VKYVLRVVAGAVGLTIGILLVIALREATLSTHQPVPANSRIEVVVTARTRDAEPGHTLDEMVEAQLLACRFQVNSNVVGNIEHQGSGRYRAVFAPTLDETNRRQFRGCLNDWLIDHFRMHVVHMREL
jgi:hypothetical protein